MKSLSIEIIKKKMKKLEKRYDKTSKECVITRHTIEKRMQKLLNQAKQIRGVKVKEDYVKQIAAS